jgi:SAM-dependent methyltransferase
VDGGASVHYVEHGEQYDRQLAPFTTLLIERARIEANHSVLDVGCGRGATTIAAAKDARTAVGIDISEPLLEIAAERARNAPVDNAESTVADAQTHPFDPGRFDLAIGQFGLMFFDDPVSAFRNLGAALAPDGRLVFICWQGLEANDWLMELGSVVARRAGLPDLGGLARGRDRFALEDPDEVATLLDEAGFARVEIELVAPTFLLGGGTVDEPLDILLGMGMARGLLERVDPGARHDAIEEIRASLTGRHEPGVGVRLGTGVLLASAHAS